MLFSTVAPEEKRKKFREGLRSGKLLQFPGSFSPLVSLQIEKAGFPGIYISGSVISNDLGYPDVGLTTLTEVAQRGRQIARTSSLPSLIDADTGFGEILNVHRSIQELIELGLSGCHLEDQMNPKRCGHLEGKSLVSRSEMLRKIQAAHQARSRDPNFVLVARTDARGVEGLNAAIDRAKAYVDAGADVIFAEALENEKEFEIFRKEVSAPLLANMTEFGKSKLLKAQTLADLGFNIVIYPVTLFRLALGESARGLDSIRKEGTQELMVPNMYTRAQLYELTQYPKYNELDQEMARYDLQAHTQKQTKVP